MNVDSLSADAVLDGVGQNRPELRRLVDLYLARKPERVLEIGVWYGGTLREWLTNAADTATVVAVDPEHQNPNLYEKWKKPGSIFHAVTGRTGSEQTDNIIRSHGPYDWVFVDGDHADDAVEHDTALALEVTRPGGLILFHDIAADGYPPLAPRIAFDNLIAEQD